MTRWHLWGPLGALLVFAVLLATLEEYAARRLASPPPPFAAIAEGARISRFDAGGVTHRIVAPQVRALRNGGVLLTHPTLSARGRGIESAAEQGEIPQRGGEIVFRGDIRHSQRIPPITVRAATLRYRFADGETRAGGGVVFAGESGEIRAPSLHWRPGEAVRFSGGVHAEIRRGE